MALTEVGSFTDKIPGTRTSYYARVSLRLQQLYAVAAKLNPEYAGVCVTGEPTPEGDADFRTVMRSEGGMVVGADMIQRVEVADPGGSGWAPGQEVHIVPLNDPQSAYPPRMVYRDGVLRSVGSEVAGVASLRVFYARRPLPVVTGAQDIDLQHPYDLLLVYDLVQHILRKVGVMTGVPQDAAIASFAQESAQLESGFAEHVQRSAPEVNRFRAPTEVPSS